jgi:DNA-binding FadR family transcriptional regulator
MEHSIFTHAKQNRVFEDVIRQVQEAILKGQLKPGDKLPAERELKEILDVSRGTLREALRVLEIKGLITIKPGVNGGAIIRKVTTGPLIESLGLLIRHQKVLLSDLAEFREGVEGIVAGLAAERAAENDIANLNDLLEEFKMQLDNKESEWTEFINMDNQIHMELARIAGNPVYESVLQTVHGNINRYYNRLLPKNRNILNEIYQDLSEIVKAVCEKDASRARLVSQKHVNRFTEFMEKQEHDRTGL